MSDYIDFFIIVTLFPLLFGPIIFLTDSILPVTPLLLGLGLFQGKDSLKGIVVGFLISFTVFRILISLLVKITEISSNTLQDIGLFFLAVVGIMLLFPAYSPWNLAKGDFLKGALYSAILGFIWSFWVGLSKAVISDYYEPEWIGFPEIYLTIVSSILPCLILMGISFVLSRIYPLNFGAWISRVLGVATLLLALCMALNVVVIKTPREGLKPKSPPPKKLYEIFNLPPA